MSFLTAYDYTFVIFWPLYCMSFLMASDYTFVIFWPLYCISSLIWLLITPLVSSNFSNVLIGWCWSLLLTILRVTFPKYGAYFLYIFVYYPFVLDIKLSTPSHIFSPGDLEDLIRPWFSLRTFSMIFVSIGIQNMKPF
jgi:hypothetical protein